MRFTTGPVQEFHVTTSPLPNHGVPPRPLAGILVLDFSQFLSGPLATLRLADLGARAPVAKTEFVVAGGGVKNATLMGMLREGLEPLGVRVRTMAELGVDARAKEAVAFALLAYETWHRRPSNVPSATGAKRPAILGKISYA